jgi:hypothetical protein
MKRFVEGEDRRQATLLPDCLDDYVTEDNPVRIVDVFVDDLNLAALGFAGIVPEVTGRPPCVLSPDHTRCADVRGSAMDRRTE